MSKNRTALIDADSLIYICSYDRSPDKAVLELHNRLNTIKEKTDTEQLALFLSLGKTFRHENKTYKSNRPKERKSPTFYYLREYMISALNANYLNGVEADDLVTYYSYQNASDIVSSPDKDVINNNFYTYNYQKDEFSERTEEDIDKFLLIQLLMGDSGDGISGIPGIGIKNAERILNESSDVNKINVVLNKYCETYGLVKGIEEFNKTFKLLYILRTNECFSTRSIQIPNEKYETISII